MRYFALAFRRTFDFRGRSTRAEYWWFQLCLIALILLMAVFGALFATVLGGKNAAMPLPILLMGLSALVVTIPNLALTVRRLHDVNFSGWWLLAPSGAMVLVSVLGSMLDSNVAAVLLLIPAAANIGLFALTVTPGTEGLNQFGSR
jgi:uncharacterized membrane protein YhaH (DUF805 family)